MTSLLDRYGIKEVADVTFYEITPDGSTGAPVLVLDTLKVSTIEQTASTADATGGKGNTKLISWDYGKDITVTLEDALFSPKSLSLMFGGQGASVAENTSGETKSFSFTPDSAIESLDGYKVWKITDGYTVSESQPSGATGDSYTISRIYNKSTGVKVTALATETEYTVEFVEGNSNVISKTIIWTPSSDVKDTTELGNYYVYRLKDGSYEVTTAANAPSSQVNGGVKIKKVYDADGTLMNDTTFKALSADTKYMIHFEDTISSSKTITVNAANFPGTYRIEGDTYARSEASGTDEFFRFIIYKAKVTAENTITLQADGDPSTFSMNLTVLRNTDGKMMDLIQYT